MKRLSRAERACFVVGVGACPSCAVFGVRFLVSRSVIYRRSARSVTMRCEDCGLQWTMTLARINAVMERKAAAIDPDERTSPVYRGLAAMTAEAARAETRGRAATARAKT